MTEKHKATIAELWSRPVLNLEQAAEILGCSRGTVYKLRDEGVIKTTRPQGMRAYLVERSEIQRIISEGYQSNCTSS